MTPKSFFKQNLFKFVALAVILLLFALSYLREGKEENRPVESPTPHPSAAFVPAVTVPGVGA